MSLIGVYCVWCIICLYGSNTVSKSLYPLCFKYLMMRIAHFMESVIIPLSLILPLPPDNKASPRISFESLEYHQGFLHATQQINCMSG